MNTSETNPTPNPATAGPISSTQLSSPSTPSADPSELASDHAPAGRRPWARDLLPLATSIVTHAAMVAMAIVFLAVTVAGPVPQTQHVEQMMPAESVPTPLANGDGVPNVGPTADPTRAPAQDATMENAAPDGTARSAGPTVEPSADGGGPAGEAVAPPILVTGGSRGGTGGFGRGVGDGAGDGSGGGGPLAQFGPPGGGAAGPKGVVFGNPNGARRIVFLCDATGTMISKLSGLKAELQRAVDNLFPFQAFNIVFYTDGGRVLIADKTGLMVANADNKRKAFDWLAEVTASGTTDPIPAIEAAFKLQPAADLVYFLSDGEFNNLRSYEEVSAAIAKGTAGKMVKVNTILFETYEKEAERVMEKIAFDNRGTYRYVREQDLR